MSGPEGRNVPSVTSRSDRADRGATLVEMMVALAILGFLLVLGLTLFWNKRKLEAEIRDRDVAVRLLASEWVFLRSAPASALTPRDEGPFIGSAAFQSAVSARDPKLTLRDDAVPGLLWVRLELTWGVKRKRVLVEEGFVRKRGGA